MAQKKTSRTDIVREYSDKYPDMPQAKLARLIFNQNKKFFTSEESTRSMVRTVRGKNGQRMKLKMDENRHEISDRPTNPYSLPEGLSEEIKPFHIPLGHNKVLILSDLHVPYHDKRAIELAVDYGKSVGVKAVHINGDLVDFYACSYFQTDPRKRDLKYEIDSTKEVLRWLRSEFESIPIYLSVGNHDRRWERYLMAKAPELLGIPEFEFSYIFGCDELGIKVLTDKQKVMMGGLSCVHGDTIFRGFGTAVSPARNAFLKTNESILAGHVHKTSEYTAMKMNGGIITCWTTGCLSDLHPDYTPHINGYNHGFAVVSFEADGTFRVENKRIFEGKIL